MKYRKRIADAVLERKLAGKGAVLVVGPKWCGKTTTAEQHANSILYMDDPRSREQNLAMADMNPSLLLDGNTPRLLDEWQLAPKLWDAVRFEVDHRQAMGQFVLTGSAVPADMSQVSHSGIGRISRLLMRPMSLYESGESTGEVSLGALFEPDGGASGKAALDIQSLAFVACRGGWPEAIDLQDDIALDQAIDYFDAVVESDICRVDGTTKDREKVRRFMRSYARSQGSQTPNTLIKADMEKGENAGVGVETVASYATALRNIFVVEDLPAWNPNLRSKTAIRTSDTRYFVDPSIAAAALGASPADLVADLKTFGFIFETLCMRDLRVYADSMGGDVYHYRDKEGRECDAVVHLPNGSYGLIEVKLGGDNAINEGAASLLKLEGKLDTATMKSPSFKMVLTGVGDYAYPRRDGVLVVPVGCLRD
jgi:uncharacterized protein